MSNAKFLKDNGGTFYPVAHTEAIYNSDGTLLEDRLQTIEQGGGGSSGAAPMENITYAALVTKATNSNLIPGTQYRITDYTCTTTQAYTKSAGHVFDIIVTADSTNKLNHDARACLHGGDTYFANRKLEAWRLKYDINNDTTKYAWADTTNGKGVIYEMTDEWGNRCGYDFKNIQYEVSEVEIYSPDTSQGNIKTQWVPRGMSVYKGTTVTAATGLYNYTFGNFSGTFADISYVGDNRVLDYDVDGDYSLSGAAYDNQIEPYYNDNHRNLRMLNFIITHGQSNRIGENCRYMCVLNNCTIGSGCSYIYNEANSGMTIGNYCDHITSGDLMLEQAVIGDNCAYIDSLYQYAYAVTIESGSYGISFHNGVGDGLHVGGNYKQIWSGGDLVSITPGTTTTLSLSYYSQYPYDSVMNIKWYLVNMDTGRVYEDTSDVNIITTGNLETTKTFNVNTSSGNWKASAECEHLGYKFYCYS